MAQTPKDAVWRRGKITLNRYRPQTETLNQILPRAIDEILAISSATHINLNGFCLGGVISNCYLGLNPDAPVKNYIAIVTPVDFDQGGLFKVWLGHDEFPVDLIVEHFGGIPPPLMASGLKCCGQLGMRQHTPAYG